MKTSTITKLKNLPAKLKVLPIVLLAILLPAIGSVQANSNLMEGNVKSLNVTTGETQYKETTNAKVDEVVQVQLWHHNRNNPAGEKMNNTKVKFDVPNQQGAKQIITGTSSSDNGNTVEGKTTVNLSKETAKLKYISGSAKFRYNKGAADGDSKCKTGFDNPPESCYATVPISDSVVTTGVNLDQIRGGPLTGCNAYHETVIIQVRAMADAVSVNKYVRHEGQGVKDWKTSISAEPGDRIEYMIRFKNEGNTVLNDVMVGDNLPKYNSYVNGSTMITTVNHPEGLPLTNDNITKGGINVGNYMPGAVGLVQFDAKLDGKDAYKECGKHTVKNVGIVRPKNMVEYYNTAQVDINVKCDEQPEYKCELLDVKELGGRKVKLNVKPAYSGDVTVNNYVYDFGDGSEPMVTDKDNLEYTYAEDGTYKIVAKINFSVNGKDKSDVTSPECEGEVTFKSGQPVTPLTPESPALAPEALPNTGSGEVIGMFLAATLAGSTAYRFVWLKRYN